MTHLREGLCAAALVLGGLTACIAHAESLLDKLKQTLPAPTQPRKADTLEEARAKAETLDPASDKLCDSLSRSYALTENVEDLSTSQLKCRITKCNPDEIVPTNPKDLDVWLRRYSTTHVWLPVSFETTVGETFRADQEKQGAILDSDAAPFQKLYETVNHALAAVVPSYPSIPYKLKIYILDVNDRINAQAIPGGSIYVTRLTVKELDEESLEFVLGHEVAHLAKRHTSKEFQARLMESELGAEIFKRLLTGRFDGNQKVAAAQQIIDRLKCSFARYGQAQETQADACSVRTLVQAGIDPIKAWNDYKQVRGAGQPDPTAAKEPAAKNCATSMESHPEDKEREHNIRYASSYHRAKTTAARPTN